MWGKTVRGMEVCEIPVRLPMNDTVMETVECMWVDIWCMLDQIVGLCHKTAEIHIPGKCYNYGTAPSKSLGRTC